MSTSGRPVENKPIPPLVKYAEALEEELFKLSNKTPETLWDLLQAEIRIQCLQTLIHPILMSNNSPVEFEAFRLKRNGEVLHSTLNITKGSEPNTVVRQYSIHSHSVLFRPSATPASTASSTLSQSSSSSASESTSTPRPGSPR